MPEHGGNLRDATRLYGRTDWLDLSAGLNPHWYPATDLPGNAWHRLPEPDTGLLAAACRYYGAPRMLAVAGTQAAIQALPRLRAPSRIAVSAPSYAEHAHHWSRHGHTARLVPYADLAGAVGCSDVVVVCNPNNPTGAMIHRDELLRWADALAARGGWLVVDEAFADMDEAHSVAGHADRPGLVVLRSVGKFFGLAGVRLGFVAGHADLLDALDEELGPWQVSGPAQTIGKTALLDEEWQRTTRVVLRAQGERLHTLLAAHGIASRGTSLFRWWPEAAPEAFHEHMAQRGIWVRLFRDGPRGIRLGLPPDEAGWTRLAGALEEWTKERR
ncbi:threonine-phosphate decarboxylase CobD [Pseudoduganella umbonata]|uniref:threonine-phosphate decarboxylase n=1 Tax=Pseudoduganella umbonata TaxID=864828 RepID=A0A4P8HTG2_9BURK|nr:threonine-phosphate decarboxylase CobD [Pseudoduganella umbonata]MBB3225386.1 cobalamin biosynthetic protein CobC [Pseudoduganella umbonata]QCP13223.1 threonine-phosphate decarboxylase [Pseudoduganella umbonata]